MRLAMGIFLLVLFGSFSQAEDAQTVQENLRTAKEKYESGLAQLQKTVKEQFDTREEKLRNAKDNRSQLKVLALEKQYFDDRGDLPPWVPAAITSQRQKLTTELEEAYQTAIRSLTKAKKDTAAAKVEKELIALWEKKFEGLDYRAGTLKDGFLRLPGQSSITTKEPVSGPIEIYAVARTTKHDIRLDAYHGSCIIFNWAGNPKELRVSWPDGNPERLENGSLATAEVVALEPYRWYQLRWLIGPGGMSVYANEKLLWSGTKSIAVDQMKSKIGIRTHTDEIEVREFRVRRIVVDR